MKPGDIVIHNKLGKARIVRVTPRGGEPGVWADFGYLQEWVPSAALRLVDVSDSSADGAASPVLPLPWGGPDVELIKKDVVDARRAVLALKLGQVPDDHVLDLSIGTDEERRTLVGTIDAVCQGRPSSILLKGPWGTGKTHLLTMLRALAANSGLATASVILDGDGVSLSDPMRLMAEILGSLRLPGESVPIDVITTTLPRLRRRFSSDFTREDDDRILDAVFRVPPSAFDEPEVTDVLSDYFMLSLSAAQANQKLRQLDHRFTLGPLTARRTDQRADRFCELLRGWASLCSLSVKGLVVVLDELDVEYYHTMRDTRQNIQRRKNRRALLEAFGRLLNYESMPLLLAFGVAPATDDVGEENDAVENLRYYVKGTIEIEAPIPDLDQMRLLGRRLLEQYARAYPDRMDRVDRKKMHQLIDDFAERHQSGLDPIPRTFVRGTLERLDVASDLDCFKSA